MRRCASLLLVPALLLVLLAPLAPGARAEEGEAEARIEALEATVARLLRYVEELRTEVAALRAELEAAPGAGAPLALAPVEGEPPSRPRADETPAEPTAREAADGPTGTFELDTAGLKAAMRVELARQMGEAATPELQEALDAMLEAQTAGMSMTLHLHADGRFEIGGSFMLDEVQAAGTWERDGETLTFHTRTEDGQPAQDPEIMTGSWRDGVIRVDDDDLPFPLVFRRGEARRPATPVPPRGLHGTYVLDTKAMDEAIAKRQAEGGDQTAFHLDLMRQIRDSALRVTLEEGGTFTALSAVYGTERRATGTYTVRDEGIVLEATERGGERLEEPQVMTGTVHSDRLVLSQEGMPFEVVLRRQ